MIKLTSANTKMPSSVFKAVSVGRAYEILRHEHFLQLKKLKEEFNTEYIRFHGLFHDDMGVAVRNADGKIQYRWHNIDKVFDLLKSINIKPIVQLGAMPEAMAEGDETIFWWKMHVSRPKNYNEWYDLVFSFTDHILSRYGLDEIKSWYFEVWNEPNLNGFWPHTMEEYFEKLYTNAAKAVKAVHSSLKVGGPATAGGDFIRDMINYCVTNSVPLDFITTHAYPLGVHCEYPDKDNCPYAPGEYFKERFKEVYNIVKTSPLPNLEIHWTEWNTMSAKDSADISWVFNPTVDMHYGGSSVAKEMLSVMDYCDSAAYWVVSDLFEERGPKHSPFSSTYGLMTIDGIPKATYNAYKLLRKLRGNRMKAEFSQTPPPFCDICATEENGILRAVLYNHHTPEFDFQPPFCDSISCEVKENGKYILTSAVIKKHNGSAYETWIEMGMPQDLSPIQKEMLFAHSTPCYDFKIITSQNNKLTFDFELQPNEVMYIEIQKQQPRADFNFKNEKENKLLNKLMMLEKK